MSSKIRFRERGKGIITQNNSKTSQLYRLKTGLIPKINIILTYCQDVSKVHSEKKKQIMYNQYLFINLSHACQGKRNSNVNKNHEKGVAVFIKCIWVTEMTL